MKQVDIVGLENLEGFDLKPWESLMPYDFKGRPYDGVEDQSSFTVLVSDELARFCAPVRWLARKLKLSGLRKAGLMEIDLSLSFVWIRTFDGQIITQFQDVDLLGKRRIWWR